MANVARKDAKRFSSLNVNSTYKGVRPESKGAGNKGGFQSLGKIGKRMPGPAQLPSLRKENAGNDPTVNLVPTGGSWGTGKEDEQQDTNKELAPSQPLPQQDTQQPTNSQQPAADNASVKKETIWATEVNNLGPPHHAPSQHFQKNFPSLEEKEARNNTKRTGSHDNVDSLHFDNEVENVTGGPPPGPYQYGPRGPRPPYSMPPHMAPPYLPRGMGGPFRQRMPPPAELYGNHSQAGSFRGYPPQQHPAPPPNAAGGHYYMPGYVAQHGPPPPGVNVGHNMDPYQEGQSKLVNSEELKNLELPEEDDDVGGWAGYHEEVDYSKKVVFDDSSDDEERSQQVVQTKRKDSSESGDIKTEALPVGEAKQPRQQPHPHPEQVPKHYYAQPPGDAHYYHGMPPQRYGYYPPNARGFPIMVASRPVDKERMAPRPPPDGSWQHGRRVTKSIPPPESAWSEDRMVTPNASQAAIPAPGDSELVENDVEQQNNDAESPNTAADKKHVTFHIDQQQPVARRQPIKVMMRDMKSATRDENDQPPAEALHHGGMGKLPYQPRPSDSDTQVMTDKQLPAQRVSAWKAADRGPITTPRTLYEPEGDKSAKKFNALIKQTASDRAKRNSGSDNVQDEQVPSPSGEIKILKSDDKQPKGKQQQSSAPPTNKEAADQKPQHLSGKTRHDSSSSRKPNKRDRPAVRQYQPPAARNQDEQVYPVENKSGGSRRPSRQQEYHEPVRYQRRKDSGQHFEGKHHPEGKHKTEGKHPSQGEEKHQSQSEGKHHSHPEGKYQSYSEGKHLDSKHQSRPEGKYQSHSEGKHLGKQHQEGKHPEGKHQSQSEGKHQKQQHYSEGRHVDGRRERPKRDKDMKELLPSQEEPSAQEDGEKTKQPGKEPHTKTAGETKQQKKKPSSSTSGGQKETTGAKSRSARGRNRHDDWSGYYDDEYYQWYGSNYDYYNYHDYDYDYQREYYPEQQRRGPSARSRQQQQSTSSSTSEKKDSTNKRTTQQSSTTGRPSRTRREESRKDEPSDGADKTQQQRGGKSKDEDKTLPDGVADNRRKRTDSKQPERRFTRSGNGGKGPAGRGTGANKTSPSNSSLDQRPGEDPQQKTTTKKDAAAAKDKAPARMVNVDINSPNVVVIDEDVTTPLSPNSTSEVDDFIKVTSKKEKRELKEQEKYRQQEKQRKAEEEENKKKHSSKKSSHRNKQHQHSSHDQTSQQETQPAPSNSWTTTTTITTQSSSIWSDSYTNLLSEGVHHPNYMTTSLIRPQGDYQLFPTSFTTASAVPLAHLSAAVDSTVAQDLPTSASQSHTLSVTEKVTSVERQDPVPSGRGVRTDLPVSKSHSSVSVGGTIGRGRGSSSRAPGSNRGVSSSNKDKRVPTSSSDSKLSSATPAGPKMSKPSTAVRSKPTPTNTTDKVSEAPATAAVVTTRHGSTTTSQVQAGGGGKRARRQQRSGDKASTQSTTVSGPANSYAGVLKSSPVHYGHAPSAGKPVAYVRPNVTDNVQVSEVGTNSPGQFPTADVGRDIVAPVTSDHHVPDATFVSAAAIVMTTTVTTTTTVKPFTFVASSVKNITNSNGSSAVTVTTSSVKRSPIREDSTRDGIEVATKRIRLGPSVQSTTVEFATKLNIAAVPFVPSIVAAQSAEAVPTPSAAAIHAATQSIVATPLATAQSVTAVATQLMIAKPIAVSSLPSVAAATPSLVSAKSIVATPSIAAPTPLVPAQSMVAKPSVAAATPSLLTARPIVAMPVPTQSTVAIPSVAAATPSIITAPSLVTTPTVAAATPSHKHPAIIAGYQFPPGTIVPAPTILPVFVPHTHMAAAPGGYALSQPGHYPSVFPAIPSHAYHIDAAHPHSIMGLAYSGGIPMQPHPQAAANNSYRFLVPTAAPPTAILQQPVQQMDYHQQQQRKKDQDLKRYSDQNIVPPMYKFPSAPLPVKVPPSSEGRRTLLESPAVVPAPLPPTLPLDNTTLTGSKRKRRGPLMPLPQQLPPAARNVTMTTLW